MSILALFSPSGVGVRLEETDYRVNESEGEVEVCVRRVGESADPITVTLRTGESSPPDAIGMYIMANMLKFEVTLQCSGLPLIQHPWDYVVKIS